MNQLTSNGRQLNTLCGGLASLVAAQVIVPKAEAASTAAKAPPAKPANRKRKRKQ